MTAVYDLPPEATFPEGRLGSYVPKDATPEDRPDFERPALSRMRTKWDLPDTLLGGTQAMHDAGIRVLPQEQDETEAEYARRKVRAVLTNYYGNTLNTHSGLPFSSPITFDPPLPDRMAYLESDADGCGRSITVFARDLLRDAMHRGLSHVLVDVPPKEEDEGFDATMRRQPRLVHIEPGALLDIDDEAGADGSDIVTYARFAQEGTEKVGRFGSKSTKSIIEIALASAAGGAVSEYQKEKDGAWSLVRESPYTQSEIPLFTLYARQDGEYEGSPAYSYLAELNLAHYQSDADQRHGLSYGRRATVVLTGWKTNSNPVEAAAREAAGDGGGTKRAILGYGRLLRNPNADASASLLETSGAPLAAGEVDLKGLEQRMERFGAQQVSQGGGITATSRQLDDRRDTCNLQAWCTREETVLLHAVRAVARWLGIDLPSNQRVKIPRDFADIGPKTQDFPMVQQLGRDGVLAAVDVLREAKVRGIVTTIGEPEEAVARAADARAQDTQAEMDRLAAQAIADRASNPPADANSAPADQAVAGGGQSTL